MKFFWEKSFNTFQQVFGGLKLNFEQKIYFKAEWWHEAEHE